MPSHIVTYHREVLYSELWREPATKVAKRYGISSSALARTCQRLRIPTPKRGYWARRAAGQQDPIPPLPSAGPAGSELTVTRRGRTPDRARTVESLATGRAAMGPPIVVPKQIDEPHSLVSSALRLLASAKSNHGLVSCRDERCLDISVAEHQLARAGRIMNTLILALEERGLLVEVTDVLPTDESEHDARSNITRVFVSGQWIRFGLAERLVQHRPPALAKPPAGLKGQERELWKHWNRPRLQLVPSGRLLLSIKEADVGVRVSWVDGRRRLEAHLNDFVKQLFVVADAKKQTHVATHSWRATYEQEVERNRAERARVEEESRRVAFVRDMLARWREARDLHQLIDEVRALHEGRQQPEWVGWADSYATRIARELEQ